MILSEEKTLEMIIQTEEQAENQIQNIAGALKEKLQAEKEVQVAMDALKEEAIETISPVIEQQLDPESYESTSYTIEIEGYSSSTYKTGKNYYELIMGDDKDRHIGASMTAIYSAHYHELLHDVQEIAANTRQGDESRHTFIEPHIDFNVREKKNSIKLVSIAMWQAMYDGKLIFN